MPTDDKWTDDKSELRALLPALVCLRRDGAMLESVCVRMRNLLDELQRNARPAQHSALFESFRILYVMKLAAGVIAHAERARDQAALELARDDDWD